MTVYGGGLRLMEILQLKVKDIHSDRKLIHVRHGKGDKERYTLLPDIVLHELRSYYTLYRPSEWLFYGVNPEKTMCKDTVQRMIPRRKNKQGLISLVVFTRFAIALQLTCLRNKQT